MPGKQSKQGISKHKRKCAQTSAVDTHLPWWSYHVTQEGQARPHILIHGSSIFFRSFSLHLSKISPPTSPSHPSNPNQTLTMSSQHTLPPLPYAYDVSLSPPSLPSPMLTTTGPGTHHLQADHGTPPPKASPNLHQQPERRPLRSSNSNPVKRCASSDHSSAKAALQRRRPHQPLPLLEKPHSTRNTGK